jgi:Flp pilus assembly pilin Flp
MDFIKSLTAKIQASGAAARAKGQAMVEYGLVLVLVSVVAIVGLTVIGGELYSPTAAHTGTGNLTAAPPDPYKLTAPAPVFNQLIVTLSNGATYK